MPPHDNCPRTEGFFIADVNGAIDRFRDQRPDIVLGEEVTEPNAFYAGVVAQLQQVGFCAMFDGEEIAIKNTNGFNEQYHVLTSRGVIRRGDGSYRATCYPSWF